MKKISFTSLIAMFVVVPAMATPSHTSDSFPQDGYMLEDYTYIDQATYENTGIYSGSVDAQAEYEDIEYNIAAGQYLAAGTTTSSQCTAGNFCEGLMGINYDANNNQGLTSCSTLDNGAYPNSVNGASANTDCYRTCNIANNGTTFTNIAHATAVSGKDYYNTTATDTCEPTACENGWHVKVGVPDLMSLIGASEAGVVYAFVDNNGNLSSGTVSSVQAAASTYGLTANDTNTFVTDYGTKGLISGHGRCSQQGGVGMWNGISTTTNPEEVSTTENLTEDSAARYCWCQLDSYTPSGGSQKSLSTPWVFSITFDSGTCSTKCANYCAYLLHKNDDSKYLAFRTAVFDSLDVSPTICEGNTITINWLDASAEAISANNAGQSVYGGDIRTPVAATDKTSIGKRFKGWRFIKPSQQSGGGQ